MNLRMMMNRCAPGPRRRSVHRNNGAVFGNSSRSLRPTLRFSPTAWAKLLFLRDRANVEVGGFGVAPAEDLLFVREFQLVLQRSMPAYLAFDPTAVADYFDRQLDAGLAFPQFARIWVHTHPGDSAKPTLTDERAFDREFGRTDWSVMFILARGGQTYARLRFNVGPGGAMLIPVAVDYSQPFAGSDEAAWQAEFDANVRACDPLEPDVAAVRGEMLNTPLIGADTDPWGDWGQQNILGQTHEEFFA